MGIVNQVGWVREAFCRRKAAHALEPRNATDRLHTTNWIQCVTTEFASVEVKKLSKKKTMGLLTAELGDALSYYGVEQLARLAASHWREDWTLKLCTFGGNIFKVAQAAKNKKRKNKW